MTRDYFHTIAGVVTPLVAVVTSMQEQIEYWLRVSGLLVGLFVGLLSLWHHIRKL